jgi:hypothetical protein
MILTIFAPIIASIFDSKKRNTGILKSLFIYSIPSILTVTILFALGIVSIYKDEAGSIAYTPFSILYALRLLPAFIQSMFCFENSFIWGLFFVLLPVTLLKTKNYIGIFLIVMGYLIIYSCHWRSYYFLVGQDVSIHDADRYLLALTPLIAILLGGCVKLLVDTSVAHIRFAGRLKLIWVGIFCTSIFIYSCVQTSITRQRLILIEQSHIGPFIQALNHCERASGSNVTIATFNICYFQIYGRSGLQLFDLRFISREPSARLDDTLRRGVVYCILNTNDLSPANQMRYSKEFNEIKKRFFTESPINIGDAVIFKQRPAI